MFMVDNERLYKLYEAMMKVELITIKEIKELGFTQHDIAKLVEDGTLIGVQIGFYNFGNVDSLFMYGKSLIDSKKRDEGIEVFKRCYTLDKDNVSVAMQLMLSSIKSKEYNEILKYYDVLYNSDNTNKRYLYYLYLISYMVELPEHYKVIVKNLKPQDLMVEETDPYTKLLNNTIGLVFNGKLSYACSIRAGWHSDNRQGVGDYTEITILKEAVACNVINKKKLEVCIMEERYDEAVELLAQESEVRDIPVYNKYVNFLLNDLVRMINFKEVHEVITANFQVTSLFSAIANYDYELALRLSEEYNQGNNLDDSKSLIYVLLKRIIKLKKEILNIEDEEVVVDKDEQVVIPEIRREFEVNEPLEGQLEMDMSSTITVSSESVIDTKKVTDQETYKEDGFVPIAKTKPFGKVNVTEEYIQDEEFIDDKINELKENRGLIVLKPMDNVRRKRIHNIVSHRREVVTFSIGSDTNRRIVLRFVGNVYVPVKETIKIADEAYYKKDYETALRTYLDILGTKSPKTFIYAKVGLTYMKMGKKEEAIEYLTVATELSKKNNERFDFSDLIASLDGTIWEYDKKPKVEFKLEEFNASEDNFGVDRIDEMLTYKEVNEVDYETACEQMGFTYEEYLLSLLVLAKRAYENKHDDLGDKFLKMVEKSGNKSKKVVMKFQEVQKNKKFYKNRGNSMVKKSSE